MPSLTRHALIAVLLGFCSLAHAVKIADITRLDGQRSNILTGLGLVYGLKGTGDGGDFMPAVKPLVEMLRKFNDPATVADLTKVQNVAVVSLIATVPKNGVRQGDKIDVYVMSLGDAGSLKGGRLFVCPMQGSIPDGGVYALSSGPVTLEDPSTPTVGVVKEGCVMEVTLQQKYVANGKFKLILEDPAASWTTSSLIARTINGAESENGETIAYSVDPKEVDVNIPPPERDRPDGFISRIEQLTVPMIPSEARVQINERTGTLIVTGDVEISPVVISHKGLTITTVSPQPTPSPANPVVRRRDTVALDTISAGGNAKLQDLVNALEELKVPVDDRITIVKELYKTGKLHAKLLVE
ncbi:MAG TPA: flagellar basal body P-ring protein FlgI [Tepidisphaeraceae bacterium]|nr:flagellar basal body P-ring protein FlgI [Tepidisphaeraceae bacterium]